MHSRYTLIWLFFVLELAGIWAVAEPVHDTAKKGKSVKPGVIARVKEQWELDSEQLLAQISTSPSDWNQWRGPMRNGVAISSPPLSRKWPASGPKIVWTTHGLPVGGCSSPVIASGKVYIYVHEWGKPEDHVVCLDSASGKKLWQSTLPSSKTWHEGSGSPCVIRGKVYVTGARVVYCLDANTGVLVWKFDPSVITQVSSISQAGQELSSSFAVVDDVAAVMLGSLVGFNAKTGKVLWYAPEPGGYSGGMTSAGCWRINGVTYLIYAGESHFCGVEPKSGKVIWDIETKTGNMTYTPSPAIWGDSMVMYFDGALSAYKLTTGQPVLLWKTPFGDEYSSPLISGNCVYTVGANEKPGSPATARCRNFVSGDISWDREVDSPEYSSPILADGKLIALTEHSKTLVMFDASPDSGELLGQTTVSAIPWTSPVIANGMLYVRITDGAVCYDLRAKQTRK